MNVREGLRVLHAYCGDSFNIWWSLAGDRNGKRRQHVMEALIGEKRPIGKCGVTAIRDAFYAALRVEGDCEARREDDFREKARAMLAEGI